MLRPQRGARPPPPARDGFDAANFSAEFGRNAGAQINTITRSGTNDFHQNSALDARNNLEKQAAATFRFLGANGFPAFTHEAERLPSPYRNKRSGGPTTATGQGTLFVLPPVEDTNGDGIPDTFEFEPERREVPRLR